MLLRPGKFSYLTLLVLLVYGWAQWSPWRTQTPKPLPVHSWQVTRETSVQQAVGVKYFQPAMYADEVYEKLKNPPQSSTTTTPSATSTMAKGPSSDLAQPSPSATAIIDKPNIAIAQEITPYAYVFYATLDEYACSVLVNIERLQNDLHTKHRIFVLASESVSEHYIKAFEQRNVVVSIETPPPLAEGGAYYYQDCLLKLYAFKMHHIDPTLKKVIALDSDQLVMKNLDHLFESSVEVDLAAPRAYWIGKDAISSTFMLISLSDRLWKTVNNAIKSVDYDVYDMDLVNSLLSDTVMMLPGSYVTPNSHWEDWNLPTWFHAEHENNITKVANVTMSLNNTTHVGGLNKRQLTADLATVGSATDGYAAKITQSNKQGAEAEQMSASSGDIFDYLVTSDDEAQAKKDQSSKDHSKAEQSHKQGAEAEQLSASSGDIFDYLEKGVSNESGTDNLAVHENDRNVSGISQAVDADEAVVHKAPFVSDQNETTNDTQELDLSEAPIIETEIELKYQSATLEEMQQRPLFDELYELVPAVSVLHFFGLGKPWTYTLDQVRENRPGSHPLFVEQFKIWRETALRICPAGILDAL